MAENKDKIFLIKRISDNSYLSSKNNDWIQESDFKTVDPKVFNTLEDASYALNIIAILQSQTNIMEVVYAERDNGNIRIVEKDDSQIEISNKPLTSVEEIMKALDERNKLIESRDYYVIRSKTDDKESPYYHKAWGIGLIDDRDTEFTNRIFLYLNKDFAEVEYRSYKKSWERVRYKEKTKFDDIFEIAKIDYKEVESRYYRAEWI